MHLASLVITWYIHDKSLRFWQQTRHWEADPLLDHRYQHFPPLLGGIPTSLICSCHGYQQEVKLQASYRPSCFSKIHSYYQTFCFILAVWQWAIGCLVSYIYHTGLKYYKKLRQACYNFLRFWPWLPLIVLQLKAKPKILHIFSYPNIFVQPVDNSEEWKWGTLNLPITIEVFTSYIIDIS